MLLIRRQQNYDQQNTNFFFFDERVSNLNVNWKQMIVASHIPLKTDGKNRGKKWAITLHYGV